MKIAVITGAFPSLSETFVINQINGLKELGDSIDVFAFEKGPASIHAELYASHTCENTIYFEFPNKRIARFLAAILVSLRLLLLHPVRLVRCLLYKVNSRYHLLNNMLCLNYFSMKKYDVLFVHYGPIAQRLLFLKKVFPHALFAVMFHGYDVGEKYDAAYYKELFRQADLFLTVNEYFKNILVKRGCDGQKCIVAYLGIDSEKFSYRKRQRDSKKGMRLLTIGRLVEKKGIRYALLALARIVEKFPDKTFSFTIIGEGVLRAELEALAKTLGLSSIVHFAGAMAQQEVLGEFYNADIFILPSVTAKGGDIEGIPTVLKEAMATGMPVISTYHSGIPELIRNEHDGFLVAEKDESAIAQRLEYLLQAPECCLRIGLQAHETVKEKFNLKKTNQYVHEIFLRGLHYAKS